MTDTRARIVGARFGYLAAFVNTTAFVWYVYIVFQAELTTNPITWWLWVGESLTGLLIYGDHTRDRSKWFLEFTALIGVVIVSGFLIIQILFGNESVVKQTVETVDYAIAALTAGALVFWITTRKRFGTLASVWMYQVVLFCAAVPLIRATWEHPTAEPFGPWALWTLAFVFLTICVRNRRESKGIDEFLYPVSNAVTHAIVAGIVLVGVWA